MTFDETPFVELKRIFTPSLKKEIVAFANTEGGTIYLGVEDDGNVVGLDNPLEVADAVNHMIHEAIVPDVSMFAEAHVERFDDVDLVVVTVHRGPQRPYCIAGKGLRPEGVYVRIGASSQPLPFDGIRHMLRQMNADSFETTRSLTQNLSFIQALSVFERQEIMFEDAQKRSLGVLGDDGQFSNIGYLLSDQCACDIKVARFTGATKAVFQTRREFGGSVLTQVKGVLEMLDMLNNVRAFVGSRPERIEKRDYPEEALREALMNAVVHRDYAIKASIAVNVFDDRCEILSPGGLPDGSTAMAALAGISIPRNSGLAAVFYRLCWIEAYGTGLMKIRDSYAGTGREAQIDFLDGAVRVILPNINERSSLATSSLSEVCSGQQGEELTEDQCAILSCLNDAVFVSKQEVVRTAGFSATKTARLLKELMMAGFVEGSGSTKARMYRRKQVPLA